MGTLKTGRRVRVNREKQSGRKLSRCLCYTSYLRKKGPHVHLYFVTERQYARKISTGNRGLRCHAAPLRIVEQCGGKRRKRQELPLEGGWEKRRRLPVRLGAPVQGRQLSPPPSDR